MLTRFHIFYARFAILGGAFLLAIAAAISAEAQTSTISHGVDPSSHLSYFEIHNPDWSFVGIAIHPSGDMIAIGLEDGDIQLFTNTFELLGTFEGHTAQIWAMDWSSDGNRLATTSADGTVKVWDVESELIIATLPIQRDTPIAVAWSADDSLLATASTTVIFYDEFGIPISDDLLEVWNTFDYSLLQSREVASIGITISWDPTSEQFIIPGDPLGPGNEILFWDISSAQVVRNIPSVWARIWTAQLSPSGQFLVYGTIGNQLDVVVIDLDTDQVIASQEFHPFPDELIAISGLAWHSANEWIAWSSSNSSDFELYHFPTSTQITIRGHQDRIRQIFWSDNGSRLISTSFDGTVRIWNTLIMPHIAHSP